jgi:hypothetical protein
MSVQTTKEDEGTAENPTFSPVLEHLEMIDFALTTCLALLMWVCVLLPTTSVMFSRHILKA